MSRILVADDDTSVLDTIAYAFEREAFEVDTVADGEAALRALQSDTYDLAILNVMMPKLYGTDVVREMQFRNGLPIVLLSARDGLAERIEGLELGADDYVTKPFELPELVARIKAVLRRSVPEPQDDVITAGPLEIDPAAFTVRKGGEELALTATEFRLLLELARRPKQVFTRDLLLELVWNYDYLGDSRLVDVAVQRLRAKIEDDPAHPTLIQTVRAVGYRFGRD
jgi:two-component system response regulator MtrA